jgi:predicted PhzF superfamily epimerase YddE/YHI9
LGRVFAEEGRGGNQTAIVWPDDGLDLAACARTLAVPDAGFVVHDDGDEVVLRTFSPFEELAQCLQASLAVVTARGHTRPPTADAPVRVRHERGEPVLVYRDAAVTWAYEEGGAMPDFEPVPLPAPLDGAVTGASAPIVLRQARSRLHLRFSTASQVEAVVLGREEVLAACSLSKTFGVVLSAPAGVGVQRIRVFTTSLDGAEDKATGGAVLGVARLLATQGHRGDVAMVQGRPGFAEDQGFLRARMTDNAVLIGGKVTALMSGNLARA